MSQLDIRAWTSVIGGLAGAVVAGIMAANLVIYLGVEGGYEAGLGDVFGHSVVLGIVAISVLVSGPVLGVTYLGRRGRHRDRTAVDGGMGGQGDVRGSS